MALDPCGCAKRREQVTYWSILVDGGCALDFNA